MSVPNVLIIADKEDVRYLDVERKSEHWNIFWKIIDYHRLSRVIGELQRLVAERKIDFVLYSRNDQVANKMSIGWVTRALRTGYSSFSGIDQNNRKEQMITCFNDFMECGHRLEFSSASQPATAIRSGGTFSIFFDTEQLACARYGLPRILNLLNKYGIPATFFVTNLLKIVYPNILKKLEGHEVGIHGMWHEYLSGLEPKEQDRLVKDIISDFGVEIKTANFVGRMDEGSVSTFVKNRIPCFVYPKINYFWLLSYPKLSTTPALVHLPEGNTWALPIAVETYGSSWYSIRNMVDSAITQSNECGFPHISILCHPFRDGNLQHIETMDKLLRYLVNKRLAPLTLGQLADKLTLEHKEHTPGKVADLLKSEKIRLSLPRTKQDFMGLIPENLMLSYSLLRRGHTVY